MRLSQFLMSWGAVACLIVLLAVAAVAQPDDKSNAPSELTFDDSDVAELDNYMHKRRQYNGQYSQPDIKYDNKPYHDKPGPRYQKPGRKYHYKRVDKPEEHHHDKEDHKCSIGLWGDLPYSATQVLTGVPNLIDDMNKHNLAFTVYDGDWKAGSPVNTSGTTAIQNCDDELYTKQIQGYFNSLEAPAMYAPGDNEWTDCDKPTSAFGRTWNSLNRLTFLRSRFFNNNPYSQGKKKMLQEVQTERCLGWADIDPHQPDATLTTTKNETCSENRRWTHKGVTYVTVNVVGSNNNLGGDYPDREEWSVRNAANINWIKESFTKAKERNSAAVMIVAQANPGFNKIPLDGSWGCRDPKTLTLQGSCGSGSDYKTGIDVNVDGFKDFLIELRKQVVAFKKPVAFVHGDAHYFLIDKPLSAENGDRLVNFTRVMTFGDNANNPNGNNEVNWVKAEVDPKSPNVFTFMPMIVRANNLDQLA